MGDSISAIATKVCCTCKQVKNLFMFSKNKRNPDGHCSQCKLCHKEHYEKNKEKSLEYYQQNKDKILARTKAYKQQNRDKVLAQRKAWRQQNKDKIRIGRQNHEAKRGRGSIDYALSHLLESAQRRAKRDNLPFDLTIEWLRAMVISHCPITLQPLDWTKEQVIDGKAGPNSPSIDKIIPKLGYVQSNCAIISYRGNMIKSNGTIDEHRRVVQYMAAQQLRDTEF